jgi:hypothetical protein
MLPELDADLAGWNGSDRPRLMSGNNVEVVAELKYVEHNEKKGL